MIKFVHESVSINYCLKLLPEQVTKHVCEPRAGLKPMQVHWAPRHGVWVDCSFVPNTPCTSEFSRNAIEISLLTKNALVRTRKF